LSQWEIMTAPSIQETPKQEYKVTPLELFFDLVFVFGVSQLSHHFLSHLSWPGAAETLVVLLAIFAVWFFDKLVGHHNPGRRAPHAPVDVDGDAAGIVHECLGDQSLHDLPMGIYPPVSADSTGACCLDDRKFYRGCVSRPLLPDASLADRGDTFVGRGRGGGPRSSSALVGAGCRVGYDWQVAGAPYPRAAAAFGERPI
jgi:hypothetical protein